ncbi:MAG: UDP-N-acetylmuramoyl-L-alanine--D-glutamate ligase [Cytophagia bacterium]|nr:UDP-N-acetylmuramoyl-L-alanine--D-glutamate ligase [Cytophagia bacterium]
MNRERLLVLGAGESGCGAARLGKVLGMEVEVWDQGTIREQRIQQLEALEIPYTASCSKEIALWKPDLVIKSPGIAPELPWIQAALDQGIPVVDEIEFAAAHTKAKLVGITGTNGKTTTTHLTHHVLKSAGLRAGIAGNMGRSFAGAVAEDLMADSNHGPEIYVLEVSSFQLDGLHKTRFDIGVLTNITPDHLDRYGYRMENYVQSKFRLVRNMDHRSALVWCSDDAYSRQGMDCLVQKPFQTYTLSWDRPSSFGGGAYTLDSQLFLEMNDKRMSMPLNELALVGRHNTYNSMAAAVVAQLMEVRKESIRESLTNFDQLEHRLEKVGRIRGVDYINDSKATNVWYALESMDKPVLWIAGGVDKGNDYTALYDLVASKVKVLICMGKDNRALHEAFAGKVPVIVNVSGMQECVQRAYQLAQKGDAVLLSPACASFDFFENYEDRGRQFKYFVNQL